MPFFHYEQQFNAYIVASHGAGLVCDEWSVDLVAKFLGNLQQYREGAARLRRRNQTFPSIMDCILPLL
jgi:UDP-N-acetylglucosamine:LPS N-acetylglucosamine transferase